MDTVLVAMLAVVTLATLLGSLLGLAAIKFKVERDPIVDKIDSILPQTQCGQCGYAGCRPYAEAIANGDNVDKCAPGGKPTTEKLADLMGLDIDMIKSDNYPEEKLQSVAFIHEDMCIGCTKCIQECPVDAISGSRKVMHTVIQKECTGCQLCISPCPTDCIKMIPLKPTPETWDWRLRTIPILNVTDAKAYSEEV